MAGSHYLKSTLINSDRLHLSPVLVRSSPEHFHVVGEVLPALEAGTHHAPHEASLT